MILRDEIQEVRCLFLRGGIEILAAERLVHRAEGRLDVIARLKRKYGQTVDEIIAFRENAASRLDEIDNSDVLCDELCATVCDGLGEGVSLLPRFSPGYGDLSLDFQREIFRLLSPERNIGVTLGERLLMSPTKSVSAIIGIKRGAVL